MASRVKSGLTPLWNSGGLTHSLLPGHRQSSLAQFLGWPHSSVDPSFLALSSTDSSFTFPLWLSLPFTAQPVPTLIITVSVILFYYCIMFFGESWKELLIYDKSCIKDKWKTDSHVNFKLKILLWYLNCWCCPEWQILTPYPVGVLLFPQPESSSIFFTLFLVLGLM